MYTSPKYLIKRNRFLCTAFCVGAMLTTATRPNCNLVEANDDAVEMAPDTRAADKPAKPVVSINREPPPFAFRDVSGHEWHSSDLRKKLVLFVFVTSDCPVVPEYTGRVKELLHKYGKSGLWLIYIFATPDVDTGATIQKFAEEQKITWTLVRDERQSLTKLFNARYTTEAFLFDRRFIPRYHGRIDDSISVASVKDRTVEEAIKDVLSEHPIRKPEVPGIGCSIGRAE